ncbi:hypothetical protein [Arthrobacter sp. VKM Ac-2550]|uniref:hypothetical protein n=1 Tax=Crystallibacter permensis TaxID=1938888 RepID=UPI002226496C|nr:hypothetical protein [Arthrobacter sp. VKM Ac-2550]MCW2132883.1 hypothetical protein [Arthrobacter sp. VKM Ac-2550]
MHWFTGHRGDWTDKDYVLSLALTAYEDGLCSCGQPIAIAHHPDNDGWYDAHKTQCHSCAARERATQSDGKQQYKPEPGEKLYTTYERPPDKPLKTS